MDDEELSTDEYLDFLQRGCDGEEIDPEEDEFYAELWEGELDDLDPELVAEFASQNLERLAQLTAEPRAGLRHMAVQALGYSDDARAVAPLLELLERQRDSMDREFCFGATTRLGPAAHEALFRAAKNTEGLMQEFALQALGKSQQGASSWLLRLVEMQPWPDGLMTAIQFSEDPVLLPELLPALGDEDPGLRGEALFTSMCLLETAREHAHEVLAQLPRKAWRERLRALAVDEDLENPGHALACLGLLRDAESLDFVVEQLRAGESPVGAVMGLCWFEEPAAHRALESLVEEDDTPLGVWAAVALLRQPILQADLRDRAEKRALAWLLAGEADEVWFHAAEALLDNDEIRIRSAQAAATQGQEALVELAIAMQFVLDHEFEAGDFTAVDEIALRVPSFGDAFEEAVRRTLEEEDADDDEMEFYEPDGADDFEEDSDEPEPRD